MNIALERETPAKRYRVKGLEVLRRPSEPAGLTGTFTTISGRIGDFTAECAPPYFVGAVPSSPRYFSIAFVSGGAPRQDSFVHLSF